MTSRALRVTAAAAALALSASAARAEIKTMPVNYRDGTLVLKGHLAFDDAQRGPRPGVLVVHEWWGLNQHARDQARRLADMGYVAFALDMYGRPEVEHPNEARKMARQVMRRKDLWRRRATLGLHVLMQQEQVDPRRIAAIGYCFGGATVLQLAYSGADITGVVSFHGSLPAPEPAEADRIRAKLLICHGSADKLVPAPAITALHDALDTAKVDWQMIWYGGAVHSFTNPTANDRDMITLRYDPKADRRSWAHMALFFEEIFGERKE